MCNKINYIDYADSVTSYKIQIKMRLNENQYFKKIIILHTEYMRSSSKQLIK